MIGAQVKNSHHRAEHHRPPGRSLGGGLIEMSRR